MFVPSLSWQIILFFMQLAQGMTGIEARRVRVVLLAGIMCNGRLHALGSPQSLKNQHGAQVRNRLPFSFSDLLVLQKHPFAKTVSG
eukprot:COSAG06_NODE_1126_length_10609_cov_228.247383_8_plen_86_part_00